MYRMRFPRHENHSKYRCRSCGFKRSLYWEVHTLDEDEFAIFVRYDIVAVQTVAIPVENVGALQALITRDPKDRLANRLGLYAIGRFDSKRQDLYSVVGPGREEIGIYSVRFTVLLRESSGRVVRFRSEIGDRV